MTILTFVWRGCAGCWEGEQWLHQQRPAGLAWAGGGRGPRTVRRTQRPGLRGQRERAAVSATSTVSQSGAAQSDRVSRSASPCHAPITLSSASVTHEPVRSPEARWGGGQRSPVRPEDSPPYLWGSYSESVPCDPPGCQHLTSSSPLALLSPQERERAGVGPWQQCPCVPSWQSPLTIDSG